MTMEQPDSGVEQVEATAAAAQPATAAKPATASAGDPAGSDAANVTAESLTAEPGSARPTDEQGAHQAESTSSTTGPRVTRLVPPHVVASIAAAIPASVRERLPEVHMTTVDLPFDLPAVEIPTIDMTTLPKVDLPKFTLPKVTVPKVSVPTLEMPTAESVRASARVVGDKASAFGRGVSQAVGIAREVVGLGERTPA